MIQSEIDYTAADRGIRSSAEHAEADVPGWGDSALTYIMVISREWNVPATMESVRKIAHAAGLPEPPEARAWGSVTQRALKAGFIRKTGQYAPAQSSNGSPKPLYVGCV